MSVQVHFGSSGLRDSTISVLKLKPHYNILGAYDLLTSVPLPIDNSRLFRSLGLRCFNISTFSFLYIFRPVDTCPPGSNAPYFLQPFGSPRFKNLKFQTYLLPDSQCLMAQIHCGNPTLEVCPEQSDSSDLFL
jgi:hypothetical protein